MGMSILPRHNFVKFWELSVLVFLSIILSADAAQPKWVVRVLLDLKRSVIVAKQGTKVAQTALKVGKLTHSLPDSEIKKLAQIANKPKGLKEVGKILGKANFIKKYGDEMGELILQDTYLRIAIKNKRISPKIAKNIFSQLGGTPGLRTLLRKINSVNPSLVKGHYRELMIGLHTEKRGFKVISFGRKFSDGIKKMDTDLDVLIRRGAKNFAIESKAYAHQVSDAMIKADAESLIVFCSHIKDTIPVFCFETAPSKLSQTFLKNKGIRCIIGTPEEIASKLDVFSAAIL